MQALGQTRILIFGLGLMGGSLALALNGHCHSIAAVDPNEDTRRRVDQLGFIAPVLAEIPPVPLVADLIILAAPVNANLKLLSGLEKTVKGEVVVLDLSSTKREIISAMRGLPPRFDPIGGHPMCGKAQASFAAADADIFKGAVFSLTPLPRTTQNARDLAEELVKHVGSEVVWLDADTHDRWVAATSHLPYLLSNCLAATTPIEAKRMVGPGFRSTTRLASSNLGMMMDILMTNRDETLHALEHYFAHLQHILNALEAEDYAGLEEDLRLGAERHAELIQGKDYGEHP